TMIAASPAVIRLQGSLLANNQTDESVQVLGGAIEQTNDCIALAGNFPVFVDEPNHDYHLAAGSVAIDHAGSGPGLHFADGDHFTRVVGAQVDCGAYEHGALFADDFEVADTGGWSAAVL